MSNRAETSQEISELTSKVHVLTTQRDAAQQQAIAAEDTAASCQASLTNLQIVLEQFQQGQFLSLFGRGGGSDSLSVYKNGQTKQCQK